MKALLNSAQIVHQKPALRQATAYNTSKFTLRDLRGCASQKRTLSHA
jgi:hypothetical protein